MRILIIVIAIISVVVAASILPGGIFFKHDKSTAKKKSSVQMSSEVIEASGNIVAIDAKKSTITLFTKAGKTLSLIMDQKTTIIYKNGKIIKSSAIKKGDSAKISYEIIKGKSIAKTVALGPR